MKRVVITSTCDRCDTETDRSVPLRIFETEGSLDLCSDCFETVRIEELHRLLRKNGQPINSEKPHICPECRHRTKTREGIAKHRRAKHGH